MWAAGLRRREAWVGVENGFILHHGALVLCVASVLLLTLKMVFLKQQNTKESLVLSLPYFKKPIIRHQSIYVIRKSLPLQSKLSSLHTVITGTKSIFNHFPDWAHQLCGNIVTCLLCKSNIWAKTITLCLLQYSLNLFACIKK